MATYSKRVIWKANTGERLFSQAAADAFVAAHPGVPLQEQVIGWEARVRRKGQKAIQKTFKKKALAERWAHQQEESISAGSFVDYRSAEVVTVKQVLLDYEKDIVSTRSKTCSDGYRIRDLITAFGAYNLHTLQPPIIVEHCEERLEQVMPDSVKRELAILSDAINTAIAFRGLSLTANPVIVAKVILRKRGLMTAGRRRERRLEEGEEQKLLGVTHTNKTVITEIIRFVLETGMRRKEIAQMRREDIDWKHSTLVITESKTDRKTGKKGRTIPLTTQALAVLRSLPARLDGAIWGLEAESISQAFERTRDQAGIVDLRFHDLRHEAISRLFELGLTVENVALISGHADWRSLKGYTHPNARKLAKALAADVSMGR